MWKKRLLMMPTVTGAFLCASAQRMSPIENGRLMNDLDGHGKSVTNLAAQAYPSTNMNDAATIGYVHAASQPPDLAPYLRRDVPGVTEPGWSLSIGDGGLSLHPWGIGFGASAFLFDEAAADWTLHGVVRRAELSAHNTDPSAHADIRDLIVSATNGLAAHTNDAGIHLTAQQTQRIAAAMTNETDPVFIAWKDSLPSMDFDDVTVDGHLEVDGRINLLGSGRYIDGLAYIHDIMSYPYYNPTWWSRAVNASNLVEGLSSAYAFMREYTDYRVGSLWPFMGGEGGPEPTVADALVTVSNAVAAVTRWRDSGDTNIWWEARGGTNLTAYMVASREVLMVEQEEGSSLPITTGKYLPTGATTNDLTEQEYNDGMFVTLYVHETEPSNYVLFPNETWRRWYAIVSDASVQSPTLEGEWYDATDEPFEKPPYSVLVAEVSTNVVASYNLVTGNVWKAVGEAKEDADDAITKSSTAMSLYNNHTAFGVIGADKHLVAGDRAKIDNALDGSAIANLVPYTGATNRVDLGEQDMVANSVYSQFLSSDTGSFNSASIATSAIDSLHIYSYIRLWYDPVEDWEAVNKGYVDVKVAPLATTQHLAEAIAAIPLPDMSGRVAVLNGTATNLTTRGWLELPQTEATNLFLRLVSSNDHIVVQEVHR